MLTHLRGAVKESLQNAPFSFQTLQTVRYELHLAKVRCRNALHPKDILTRKRLAHMDDIKLHWGCGGRKLEGWINIDGFPSPAVDFVMDLRTRLPFRDNAVRYIFTEHVLEHIEAHHGRQVLKDFYRVLKPGGVVRIIVPDLETMCKSYIAEDKDFFQTVIEQSGPVSHGVNNIFYGHFHRCMYDYESLAKALHEAGFSHVERSTHLGSAHQELRKDTDKASRRLVSLYVEARK